MAAASHGSAMDIEYQELVTYGVWRGGRFPRENGPESSHGRRCWAGETEERHGLVAVDDGHTLNLMRRLS
jgi:hypothetical protein